MSTNDSSAPLTRFGKAMAVPKFHGWEALCMRILFALVILQTLPLQTLDFDYSPFQSGSILAPARPVLYDSQPIPNGLGRWIDFSFMADPNLQTALWILSLCCLVSYILGRGLLFSLPILTFITIAARTLENSQGFVNHKYTIVAQILLVQSVVVIWFAARRHFAGERGDRSTPGDRSLHDYLIRYTQMVIVAVYVISGCTKLIASDGEWIAKSPYIGLYLVKTDRQNYYNKLDAENFGGDVPVAAKMLEHPNISRVFMGAGLLLELFAFVALCNRFTALGIGVALVVFHQAVLHFMALTFPLNEKVIWIFLINVPFWIGSGILFLRRNHDGSAAPEIT